MATHHTTNDPYITHPTARAAVADLMAYLADADVPAEVTWSTAGVTIRYFAGGWAYATNVWVSTGALKVRHYVNYQQRTGVAATDLVDEYRRAVRLTTTEVAG